MNSLNLRDCKPGGTSSPQQNVNPVATIRLVPLNASPLLSQFTQNFVHFSDNSLIPQKPTNFSPVQRSTRPPPTLQRPTLKKKKKKKKFRRPWRHINPERFLTFLGHPLVSVEKMSPPTRSTHSPVKPKKNHNSVQFNFLKFFKNYFSYANDMLMRYFNENWTSIQHNAISCQFLTTRNTHEHLVKWFKLIQINSFKTLWFLSTRHRPLPVHHPKTKQILTRRNVPSLRRLHVFFLI